ncbi:MAG: 3-oxoacyl-[acyl-carrier-protein] reductase [Dongiaceae bacterium]
MPLQNKTALVTGATGGIGHAIAKSLHQAGATVMLSGTKEDVLQKLKAEFGERTHICPANLGDAAAIENLIAESEKAMGKIDVLVNNAGITRDGLLMRMKDEDWETVLNVNLTSVFRLSRAAIRGMMKNRFGRIICISSVVGETGNAGQCNYAAAKAGMIGFVKSLALEVASRGITVNAIAPGFIATPMTDVLTPEQKEKINSRIPLARMGAADDIAAAALYLADDSGAYVTGQTLHINGGMAMV